MRLSLLNLLKQGRTRETRAPLRQEPNLLGLHRPLRIAIVNFWSNAFVGDFFDYLIHKSTNGQYAYVRAIKNADVIISSVFGSTKTSPEKTIFYTGENVRPDFSKCAFSLSFEEDTWGGKNHYLPLWYSRLAWPGFHMAGPSKKKDRPHLYEPLIPIESLTSPRTPVKFAEKPKFCAIIASNPETLRMSLVRELSEYSPVDGYGRAFGKPLHASKFETLKPYRFCLCPENDVWPGYVTEKLFDAWYAGTLPVYSGITARQDGLNPSSFLNYIDSPSIDLLMKKIETLDSNERAFNELYQQPLLQKRPELTDTILFLRASFLNILNHQKLNG